MLSTDLEKRREELEDIGLTVITDKTRERWDENLRKQDVPLDKHFKFGELRGATFDQCDLTGVTVEERDGNVISLADLFLTDDKERVKDVLKGTISSTLTVKFSNEDEKQSKITQFIKKNWKPVTKLKGDGIDLTGWNQPAEDLADHSLPNFRIPGESKGKEKKEEQEVFHVIGDDESVDSTADDKQVVEDDFYDFSQRKYTSTQGDISVKKKEKKESSEVDLAEVQLPALAGTSGS